MVIISFFLQTFDQGLHSGAYYTIHRFAAAMDAKHVVASTDSDGSVHLVCGDRAASFPSPILQKLYAVPEDSDEKADTKRKMDEDDGGDAKAAASQETDLLTLQPWRRQVLTAARELIQAFDERSDINMEDCPVYEELQAMEEKATADKDMDMEHAGDVLHAAQMFLYICDTDF